MKEKALKDMKVFMEQRLSPEVFAEEARLRNGQTFLHFDWLCGSANQKTGKACEKRQNGEMFSSVPNAPLESLLCRRNEDKLSDCRPSNRKQECSRND